MKHALNYRKLGATETICLVKDLTKTEQCQETIDETVGKMGGLNILIGNAGAGTLGTVRGLKEEDFRWTFELNLMANVTLTKHALPHLEKTKGNILFISSIAGLFVNICCDVNCLLSFLFFKGTGQMPMGAAYNSVKAALDHYARQVALEEAPKGIRVNVVSPGCIMVEYQMAMYGKVMSKEEE